jgi:MoaA/NifB/PqqE/SkfB family radical SAM enzyme
MHTDPSVSSTDISKTALSVHVYATNACNLKCGHCYYDALLPGDRAYERSLHETALDEILRVLAFEFDSDIHLEGGEPFLHPGLHSVLVGLPNSALRAITVTTNGLVRLRSDSEYLSKLQMLRVSVEGHTDELQQRVRSVPLSGILANLQPLLLNGVPVTLRITLFPHSAARTEEMISTFLGLGFRRFSLFECQPAGRAGATHPGALREPQLQQVLAQMASFASEDRIERLTLHLPESRAALVSRDTDAEHGLVVRQIEPLPNLTINSNGDLGSCPWRITARKTSDRFDSYVPGQLGEQIRQALRAGKLWAPCEFLSGFVVSVR